MFVSNFFTKKKDGGPNSPVDGYFLIEIKSLFSISLLKFNKGGRESFHSHAFNALTWFIKGDLVEQRLGKREDGTKGMKYYTYKRSLIPKFTSKFNSHRVVAAKDSWCLTVRGPWCKYWHEYNEGRNETTVMTHGRKVISKMPGRGL